jgi:hypothetical protein
MQHRSFNWVVTLVALGLAGVIGVGAAPARSAATAFELTFEAEFLPPDFMTTEGGTFRSRAPFCAGGTFVQGVVGYPDGLQFTCDDGTGSLTVVFPPLSEGGGWRILDGSGSYAGLRGRGSLRGEELCRPWLGENCNPNWRGTLVGVVDWGVEPEWVAPTNADTNADTVAPSLAFTSASVTKLRRPAGAYSIKVALSLRDDVDGNAVAYMLRVTQTRAHRLIVLASNEGTTASGSLSTTLRVVPGKRVRSVQLRLSGSDPNGNEQFLVRSLKLPRS